MGGATRFVSLLATPFPPLRPSVLLLRRRFSLTTFRLLNRSSPSKTRSLIPLVVSSYHSQTSNNTATFYSSAQHQHNQHHPWPEWTHFLNILFSRNEFSAPEHRVIPPENAFVVYEELPDDFVSAAAVCFSFSRDRPNLIRLLSKRDIEAVVSNGTPFLFKSALDTARRMRTFLETDENNVSEFDKANTTDLMKYILSYASNPTVSSEKNGLYSRELVDLSIRNLLHELSALSCGAPDSVPTSGNQFSGWGGQIPRPLGQNIEMKRGDWICPKCSFMNFARNMKCLECEEQRPRKQLTGREWECPQCNFCNYGRNSVCLRCDCRQPGAPLLDSNNLQSSSGYNRNNYYNRKMDEKLPETEKSQSWFSNISQLNNDTETNGAPSDENFPEITSLKKMSSARRLANTHHRNNLGNNDNLEGANSTIDPSNSQGLDNSVWASPTVFDRDDLQNTPYQNFGTEISSSPSQSGSADFRYSRSSNASHGPSMQLRSDAFSNRDNASEMDCRQEVSTNVEEAASPEVWKKTDVQNKDIEQANKSERWFRRMSELHNVKDLPSAISDEDFPEIMPMRKGENQFVVSKKKDRSLTSPKYKRQIAMDQANNSSFVPFVPFPPGYFARKDTEQSGSPDSSVEASSHTSSSKLLPETEKLEYSKYGMVDASTSSSKDQELATSSTSHFSSQTLTDSSASQTHSESVDSTLHFSSGHSSHAATQSSSTSHNTIKNEGYSGMRTSLVSPQVPKSENVNMSWRSNSLEGSAVKEPDPLDMSEEAKAERWFKRVAQIKDISELSQIPDEDFPSIMPMRKGVNRFVVSKRKTPLERRLTSQQYRRNLPIVNRDSMKKEDDNS